MSFFELVKLVLAFPGFLVSLVKVVEHIQQHLKKEKK